MTDAQKDAMQTNFHPSLPLGRNSQGLFSPILFFQTDGQVVMMPPVSGNVDRMDLSLLESRFNEEIFELKTKLNKVLELLEERGEDKN